MQNSKIITPHNDFYRATSGDESRYYPLNRKDLAIAFDGRNDPVQMRGFGVYDTTVSTSYAVALYATVTEAEAHAVSRAPVAEPVLPETDEAGTMIDNAADEIEDSDEFSEPLQPFKSRRKPRTDED